MDGLWPGPSLSRKAYPGYVSAMKCLDRGRTGSAMSSLPGRGYRSLWCNRFLCPPEDPRPPPDMFARFPTDRRSPSFVLQTSAAIPSRILADGI